MDNNFDNSLLNISVDEKEVNKEQEQYRSDDLISDGLQEKASEFKSQIVLDVMRMKEKNGGVLNPMNASGNVKALQNRKYNNFYRDTKAQANVFATIPKRDVFTDGGFSQTSVLSAGVKYSDGKMRIADATYWKEYNHIVQNTTSSKFASKDANIRSKIAKLNKRWDKQAASRKATAKDLMDNSKKMRKIQNSILEDDEKTLQFFTRMNAKEREDYAHNPAKISACVKKANEIMNKRFHLGSFQRAEDILKGYGKLMEMKPGLHKFVNETTKFELGNFGNSAKLVEAAKKKIEKLGKLETLLKPAVQQIQKHGEIPKADREKLFDGLSKMMGKNILIKGSVKERAFNDRMYQNMNDFLEGNMLGLKERKLDRRTLDADAEEQESALEKKKFRKNQNVDDLEFTGLKEIEEQVKKEKAEKKDQKKDKYEIPQELRDLGINKISQGDDEWDRQLEEKQKKDREMEKQQKDALQKELDEENAKIAKIKERLAKEEEENQKKIDKDRAEYKLKKKANAKMKQAMTSDLKKFAADLKMAQEKKEQDEIAERKRQAAEKKQREKDENKRMLEELEKERQKSRQKVVDNVKEKNRIYRSVRTAEINQEQKGKKMPDFNNIINNED